MIAAAVALVVWDFASDDQGFVAGDLAQWEWGVPIDGPGGSDTVWGTDLDGPYLNDATDTLTVALPDLSAAADPVIVFTHWYEARSGDYGTVEIDDGTGWRTVEPIYGYPEASGFTGSSGGWVTSSVDLTGLGAGAQLRFVFTSDLIIADAGWYLADVAVYDGDATPPRLTVLEQPEDTQDLDGPYVITVAADDDNALTGITAVVTYNGADGGTLTGVDQGDGTWRIEIPGREPDTTVAWHAVADDGNQQTRAPAADASFRVYLAAPTDLRAPSTRLVGTDVTLAWDPPDSPHTVVGYEVTEDGGETTWSTQTTATVPVGPDGSHVFTVRAVYGVGTGDSSDALAVDIEVPQLTVVDPDAAYQGDRVYVRFEGESLYLLDGTSTIDLGEDVSVEAFDVLDASRADAIVAIDALADAGPRDVALTTAWGTFEFADAFTVRDGAERPTVTAVVPAKVSQGEAATISVHTSAPFAGAVEVEADGDFVVASEPIVEGDAVTFDVVVAGDAAIGSHVLVLDDGERLWSATLQVEERVLEPGRRCSTAPAAAGPVAWLLAAVVARRRRSARAGC